MQKILIVVDMQNDFIDGALGTKEAVAIVPRVKEIIEGFDGKVIFTRDTHKENYMETQEGRNLPVPHCIENSEGWQIEKSLAPYASKVINKPTFGSLELLNLIDEENNADPIEEIMLIGLCTDICVISNALVLRGLYHNMEIVVDSNSCAGVTPEKHKAALEVMKSCQIEVI